MQTETLKVPPELRDEWEILTSGCVDLLPCQEFLDRVIEAKCSKRPIRIKLGCDPSAPNLHVGHAVVINKLRQFQELGHQVVFIIGDFTARIGDPTGKSETRKALTLEETRANAKTYLDQLFLLLDRDKTEVVHNSQWFEKMNMNDVISLASKYTVARMLERDDFAKRYAENRAIHVHEFLYPLVQGYDSIMVRADIELGGTDQKFNLLVGRHLMEEHGMRGQCIMTMPLIVGLDGQQKMGKSLGNAIWITEPAEEIFGKTMSLPDEIMADFFHLVLAYSRAKTDALIDDLKSGRAHPRDLKARLARELVARFHGEESAAKAAEGFDRVFRENEAPEAIEEARVSAANSGEPVRLTDALVQAGLAKSGGEAKRLIRQNGVRVEGETIDSELATLGRRESPYLIQVGKRHFRRVFVL